MRTSAPAVDPPSSSNTSPRRPRTGEHSPTGGPGSSNGNICVSGQIGRHNAQAANSGQFGTIRIQVDLNNLPRPVGSAAVVSGETWHFQCWYREAASSNFTDGISLTFQ
ncbi:MAG: hypothetical protein GY711_06875 [bacterium]|nr:hypothetical protein [bacterium]